MADNERLGRRVEQLLRDKFGKSSEKIDPNQLSLFAQEIIAAYQAENAAPKEPTPRAKGGGGRKAPRPDLPTEKETYELNEEQKKCPECKGDRNVIGSESYKELEYIPGSFKVIEHVQLKYSCKSCQGHVELAPRTGSQPIAKGMSGFGLLAQIITSRYCDHLPLYRQEQIYWRQGAEIARSTMCRWMQACASKAKQLYIVEKEEVLKSKYIHADETPIKFIKKGAGQAQTGYAWTYLGDEQHRYLVFEFHPNRNHEHAQNFLKDYDGFVQADGYQGYDALHDAAKAKRLSCMAHFRRYFEKALSSDHAAAGEALARINVLYKIEENAKDKSEDERFELRQRDAMPRLDDFKSWLQELSTRKLPKSPVGKAIYYGLGRWEKLSRYTEKGFLPIDNNPAERALRPVAIGRKNWMFLGDEDAGETFSILASLSNTCKIHGVDPFKYWKDILRRLTNNDYDSLQDLLPDRWQAKYAGCI